MAKKCANGQFAQIAVANSVPLFFQNGTKKKEYLIPPKFMLKSTAAS